MAATAREANGADWWPAIPKVVERRHPDAAAITAKLGRMQLPPWQKLERKSSRYRFNAGSGAGLFINTTGLGLSGSSPDQRQPNPAR